VWGRFDGEHAHAVSDTLWRIGLVASETDGTVVFQPSPAPVNLTAARLATLNARLQSGASPAIVTTNSSCIAGS
ncbi:MAG: hypothetical protein ACR2J9_04155, partial [Gaiellales bacterium]